MKQQIIINIGIVIALIIFGIALYSVNKSDITSQENKFHISPLHGDTLKIPVYDVDNKLIVNDNTKCYLTLYNNFGSKVLTKEPMIFNAEGYYSYTQSNWLNVKNGVMEWSYNDD